MVAITVLDNTTGLKSAMSWIQVVLDFLFCFGFIQGNNNSLLIVKCKGKELVHTIITENVKSDKNFEGKIS